MEVEDPGEARNIKQIKFYFTYMIDAIGSQRESIQQSEYLEKLKSSIPGEISDIDSLLSTIIKSFESFRNEKGISNILETETTIINFTKAALENYKKKITEERNLKISEISSNVSALILNANKSMQAYLSSDPIDILDYSITVKWINGAYEGLAKYSCQNSVEYDFTLNTRNSELLKESLKFSTLEKGLKIPVRSASTWIGKEPQLDYERLDKYSLVSASITKGNLFVNFQDPEKSSSFVFVMSRGTDSSFLSIEYKDENGEVDITGQPALNNMLEIERIEDPLDRIYGTLLELEQNKLKLSRLSVNGKDILSTSSYLEFGKFIFDIMNGKFIEVIKNLPEKGKEQSPTGGLSKNYIKERLRVLGQLGNEMLQGLGFTDKKTD
ncbi:MAG: hypothetical protein ACYDDC_01280 [Thermoplasmataceae archaeon]